MKPTAAPVCSPGAVRRGHARTLAFRLTFTGFPSMVIGVVWKPWVLATVNVFPDDDGGGLVLTGIRITRVAGAVLLAGSRVKTADMG